MMPHLNKKPFRKAPPTLFKSSADLKSALLLSIDILKEIADKAADKGGGVHKIQTDEIEVSIPYDSEGFVTIQDMREAIKALIPYLDYINDNHIVEFYFKDRDQKILINGDYQIKYKIVRYVQPPDTLYFGTLANLADRMRETGLRSHTKKYIKLYESPEMAEEFASKFATREDDKVVILEINAAKAFSEGMKFSTYKDGEYIIVRVDKKYIQN
jgi:RNA:NAD 2'-phosphotransferase (TPT1/KptA family)